MKYILNETPIKTTNGFRVNNVIVDLDLPSKYNFHDYEISSINNIKSNILNGFKSRIGLEHEEYKNTIINMDNQIDNLIKLEYKFKDEDDNLIDNIDINVDNNLVINMFINYESINNNINFHNGNININIKDNSTLNLTILNKMNEKSINMISGEINTSLNSSVKINLIDLSGKIRIYNFKSNTVNNSNSTLNNIYIGKDNDLIDMNYYYINEEENTSNIIELQGLLDNKSIKSFKGTIDFKEGSKKSIGHENENCLLLSNDAKSKSLPILLCHEEDVDGKHSVSSGKIDQNKLFYLMTRGLSKEESKKLIIKGNFNHIINEVPEELREIVINYIDEII